MARRIDVAIELVLADLDPDDEVRPRVLESNWQTGQQSESASLVASDGSSAGVWLDLSLPEAEALVHLADQVQEWVVEELCRLRRPTNWPTCPAHPANHPRRPTVEGGRAVWACPVGAASAVPIGQSHPCVVKPSRMAFGTPTARPIAVE